MISVQTKVEIQGDLSLANISRELEKTNIPKEILKSAIGKLQDELLLQLCGRRYQRDRDRKFIRVGSTNRTLSTRHGRIEFRLTKVRCLENGSIMRPLLLYVGVEPKKRIIDDLTLECAEIATYLTYRDSKTVIENLTNAHVSKWRVHECVQRVGDFMNSERRKSPMKSQDLIEGDGTKCHSLGGKKNEINVILGKDQATGEKSLLGLSVNEDWKTTLSQFKGRAKVAVSDNEPSLRNALLEKAFSYQACIRHCAGDVRFYLWSAKVPKNQRDKLAAKLEGILEILHNSVNKHLVDGDFGRLEWRINLTLSELGVFSRELLEAGLPVVARFVRNAANYMVTYARLAMKGAQIPMTNNLIERLMGEVAKRVKHKWMHWSTRALENLLNILLARYCNRRVYGELKERYLRSKVTTIRIAIT
ncbi:MAG: ISH6 family transposase [Methanocella sp.]